ncbi:MAG: DUF3788 domain-containing protein [Candidatus Thorarchaeota archaeon]|nr:DUF3788 domain-containing protein [Candidatus Thorarchaeota archaeon]
MTESPRMIDKTQEPTEEEMMIFIGEQAGDVWVELRHFIEDNYDFLPETAFYGAKHGWTVRYRRSGRTLCSLFPEKGGFSVLIVLGRKDSEKALSMRDELSTRMNTILRSTEQLHDGRWLWIRMLAMNDVDDVKKLLQTKRKPKGRISIES